MVLISGALPSLFSTRAIHSATASPNANALGLYSRLNACPPPSTSTHTSNGSPSTPLSFSRCLTSSSRLKKRSESSTGTSVSPTPWLQKNQGTFTLRPLSGLQRLLQVVYR